MRLCSVLLSLALTAQVFAAQTPAFEVASVSLAPGPGSTSQRMTDTRVDLTLINLRALLLLAFRAKGYELVGPDWLAETRVSIRATLPPGAKRQQIPDMLQRLLAERFHLVVHREPRPRDVYERVVGPGGHTMREGTRKWGNMQVVIWDYRSGKVEAASDPRGAGVGLVY